jgi:hypothetical protein
MLKAYNLYCKSNWLKKEIYIDKDFPRETLIKVMRPYLLFYLIFQDSINLSC